MNNTRMMYVRPGNLFKDFIIEENKQIVTSTGRVANSHTGDGTKTLKGGDHFPVDIGYLAFDSCPNSTTGTPRLSIRYGAGDGETNGNF